MHKSMRSVAVSLLFAAAACGGDDDDQGEPDDGSETPDAGGSGPDAAAGACAVTPGAWAAPDFAASAADALALRDQLDALGALMRGAEQETMTVDEIGDLKPRSTTQATPASPLRSPPPTHRWSRTRSPTSSR